MAEGGLLETKADFLFKVGALDANMLKVTAFEGTEGLSTLYRFQVDLCSDDEAIAVADMVGQPCYLEIHSPNGSRFVHGIVRRFARTGQGVHLTYYRVHIVPAHWLLTKRHRCRIFQSHNCQDMSVPGIIKQVLQDAGIPDDAYRMAFQNTYTTREYVVQYRESEMDFISRLMEEEGIYYFFEHAAEGHKLVIADGDVAHVELPTHPECVYRDPSGLVPEEEHVFGLHDTASIAIGAVELDDFNFVRPGQDIRQNNNAAQFTNLMFSDYPGRFREKDAGGHLAQVRLEAFQCTRHTTSLSATVRGFIPGYTFQLADHPSEETNRQYLISGVHHQGRQPQSTEEEAPVTDMAGYEATVTALPKEVPFRAQFVTHKPRIAGAQTAIVVGPKGEELYTDEYGRVKVQFHWDPEGTYNEDSSCWIRVSQGAAGGQYGMMFLPRVGQEVVVEFLEGDPDRPLITGRVYNNDHMPPYKLPAEKTKSVIKTNSSKGGGGTNEICFEDLKDSEQILLYAQKDLHLRVKNDRVENVEHDRHLTVDNDMTALVQANRSLTVKGDQTAKIDGDLSHEVGGKVSRKVAGTLSVTCDGDVVHAFNANHKQEVSQIHLTKAQNIKLEASTAIELAVGGNSIIISSSGISMKQGGATFGLVGNTVFVKGGPTVMINTAPAPPGTPVGPVTASATSPDAAAEPLEARTATPGADKTYSKQAQEYEAVEVESLVAEEPTEEPPPPVETSWIEIELVDEADQPVAGERYELKLPDGKIRRGTLDANGLARVEGIPPGQCEVCFPNLDAAAWEQI